MLFGATDYYPPSRFLSEIPEELMHVLGAGAERGAADVVGPARPGAAPPGGGRGGDAPGAVDAPSGPTGARGAEGMGLRVGDDVSHDKFGEGVILELVGDGDKAEAVVHFRDVGREAPAAGLGAAGEGRAPRPVVRRAGPGAGDRSAAPLVGAAEPISVR